MLNTYKILLIIFIYYYDFIFKLNDYIIIT